MARIDLLRGSFGTYILAKSDGSDDLLVQTDYDYPGVASTFGWDIRASRGASGWDSCPHDGTDGTVACPFCGRTASAFINDAGDYLDDHIGASVEDPGYFTSN
jgi:hypothetical protein